MSTYISGSKRTFAHPIIKIPDRKVISTRFKNLLKDGTGSYHRSQKKYIANLHQEFTAKEKSLLNKKNELFLQKQFKKMKKDMLAYSSKNIQQKSSIQIYFDEIQEDEPFEPRGIKNYPATIDISKKYNIQINRQLKAIKQAKKVDEDKESYRVWMNSSHNNPIKSPNYSKMNYLIEKLCQKNQYLTRERYTTNINEKETIMRKKKDKFYHPGIRLVKNIK